MSVKVVTVIGARPQFIKAAAVSRAIRNDPTARIREVIVHTGQHFDDNMSTVFFEELDIPRPDHALGVAGGGHGEMTGRMLERVERVLVAEAPDESAVVALDIVEGHDMRLPCGDGRGGLGHEGVP